jgi:hypothetical protein
VSEILDVLRQENRRLESELEADRAKLDELEQKQFVEDVDRKNMKALYQACRVLARCVPRKTKKGRGAIWRVRALFQSRALKAPPEFYLKHLKKDSPPF